jgi:hypothetical protein
VYQNQSRRKYLKCSNLNLIRQDHVQDIPALSAEAAKQHPGVSYIITAPLGLHELLVVIIYFIFTLTHLFGDELVLVW